MEGRKRNHRKIIGAALIAAFLILFVVWIRAVICVNREVPQPVNVLYQSGEWAPWGENLQIRCNSYRFMDDQEIRSSGKVSEPGLFDYEMKIIWIQADVKNTGTKPQVKNMSDLAIESPGWTNMVDIQYYDELGDTEKPLEAEIQPGETVSYELPFLMVKANFRNVEWKKIPDKKYYIILQRYPEKRRIEVNRL